MKKQLLLLALLTSMLALAGCHSDDMDHHHDSMNGMNDMNKSNSMNK